MTGEAGSIKYSLRQPFERAVESVCDCLSSHGLQIAGHLDVANRLERKLGIVLAPCRIVFILPNPTLLSRDSIHPWAATLLPLHVVISGNNLQTEIEVLNRIRPSDDAASALFRPVLETQTKIAESVDAIAMRPSLVV